MNRRFDTNFLHNTAPTCDLIMKFSQKSLFPLLVNKEVILLINSMKLKMKNVLLSKLWKSESCPIERCLNSLKFGHRFENFQSWLFFTLLVRICYNTNSNSLLFSVDWSSKLLLNFESFCAFEWKIKTKQLMKYLVQILWSSHEILRY